MPDDVLIDILLMRFAVVKCNVIAVYDADKDDCDNLDLNASNKKTKENIVVYVLLYS